MHLLLALLFLCPGSSATAQAADLSSPAASRFMPWLEVPSFYHITKRQKKYWDENGPAKAQLLELMNSAYLTLETETFNQADALNSLIKLSDPIYNECAALEEPDLHACRNDAALNTFAELRDENLIDDVAYRILWNAVDKGDEAGERSRTGYTSLQSYWNKLHELDRLKKVPFSINPYQAKRFNSRLGGYNTSARQRLYLKYTYLQIEAMGHLISTLLKRMNSAMSIDMDYDHDGVIDDKIPLSEGEAEAHAKALFERIKARAHAGLMTGDTEKDASPYLNGLDFTDTDLILASVESGKIPINVIEVLSKDPEINDPQHATGKKLLKIGGQVLTAAFLSNPATASFSAVAMIMFETYKTVKSEKKKVSDDILN